MIEWRTVHDRLRHLGTDHCSTVNLQPHHSIITETAGTRDICDFLLVVNSDYGLSPAVFEILTFKARK